MLEKQCTQPSHRAVAAMKENEPVVESTVEELLVTGTLCHKSGDFDRARKLYLEALEREPGCAEAYHLLGLLMVHVGQPQLGREMVETAISLGGESAVYLSSLGSAQYELNAVEEAVESFTRAQKLDRDNFEANFYLGLIHREQERYEDAGLCLAAAHRKAPENVEVAARLAECVYRLQAYDEAVRLCEKALQLDPGNPIANRVKANCLLLNRPSEALTIAEQLVARDPGNDENYALLGAIYAAMGRKREAVHNAKLALRINPDSVSNRNLLASILADSGKWEEALAQFDSVLSEEPTNLSALMAKAGLLERMGRAEEAFEHVRDLVVGQTKFDASAFVTYLHLARRVDRHDEALDLVERVRQMEGLPGVLVSRVLFDAAVLYEDRHQDAKAFEALTQANRLAPREYDRALWEERFGAAMETFDAPFFRETPQASKTSDRPIFIVGMPRSGTSLTEKVLASHHDVFGAGELGAMNELAGTLGNRLGDDRPYPRCAQGIDGSIANALAAEYLQHLKEIAPPEARFVVDKMPHNFLHLGLISVMFPEARIVHCRRDARDVALSCFYQNFSAAGLGYAFDLDSIAHFYAHYERLMRHWNNVLPMPVFDQEYETMVSDPEGSARRLVDYCGLEWSDAFLNFHRSTEHTRTASYDQVRKPVYQSSKARWRRYEKQMAPFIEALEGYRRDIEQRYPGAA